MDQASSILSKSWTSSKWFSWMLLILEFLRHGLTSFEDTSAESIMETRRGNHNDLCTLTNNADLPAQVIILSNNRI